LFSVYTITQDIRKHNREKAFFIRVHEAYHGSAKNNLKSRCIFIIPGNVQNKRTLRVPLAFGVLFIYFPAVCCKKHELRGGIWTWMFSV
jgi:hypothetical protein